MDSEIPTPLAGRSPPGVGVAFLRNRLASKTNIAQLAGDENLSQSGVRIYPGTSGRWSAIGQKLALILQPKRWRSQSTVRLLGAGGMAAVFKMVASYFGEMKTQKDAYLGSNFVLIEIMDPKLYE